MAESFEGEGTDVESAEDDAGAESAVTIGERVRLEDLRGEAGDGDGIELFGNASDGGEICNLKVADVDVRRCEPCESEKAQAGERGDDLASLDKAGQSEAEGKEFGVAYADPAHCNQTEFHRGQPPMRITRMPVVMDRTGMGKKCRRGLRHAERKQQRGMVAAPSIKAHEAMASARLSSGS